MELNIIPILIGMFGVGIIVGVLSIRWHVYKRTNLTIKRLIDIQMRLAIRWWNEMPIDDIYSGLGNVNLVHKYYPHKLSYKSVTPLEILHMYVSEDGRVIPDNEHKYFNEVTPSKDVVDNLKRAKELLESSKISDNKKQ